MIHLRYASAYIDRVFAERDEIALYQIVGAISAERQLSEEFWLFCRLQEWTGSTRSGVWQYYEGLPEETFRRVSAGLEQRGLNKIADQYRFGKSFWDTPDQAAGLDRWLDDHGQEDCVIVHR